MAYLRRRDSTGQAVEPSGKCFACSENWYLIVFAGHILVSFQLSTLCFVFWDEKLRLLGRRFLCSLNKRWSRHTLFFPVWCLSGDAQPLRFVSGSKDLEVLGIATEHMLLSRCFGGFRIFLWFSAGTLCELYTCLDVYCFVESMVLSMFCMTT